MKYFKIKENKVKTKIILQKKEILKKPKSILKFFKKVHVPEYDIDNNYLSNISSI
jgi:hypothetical protein